MHFNKLEIADQTRLYVTKLTDANMSFLNHSYIIRAIPDRKCHTFFITRD